MSNAPTILYVDDEPINLLLFETNFKKNYRIVKASSGMEALEKLGSNPDISIVISDMKMPNMSGIEFITLAKREYPNIAFFILTGFDITDDVATALQSKLINMYFRKPFDMREIEAALQGAV